MDISNLSSNRLTKIKTTSLFTILSRLLAVLVGLYFIFNTALYCFQEKIIFFPRVISNDYCVQVLNTHSNLRAVSLKMKDGTSLHGWLVEHPSANSSKLLIYFGGSGDELSDMIQPFQTFTDWSVVLINYRGFGNSEGKPSEQNLLSDASEVYDYFASKPEYAAAKKVVMGRSLGTGVAVYVAQNRPVDGVILVSPYDSLSSVAQEILPMLPVKYLLRNNFNSIERAPHISAPVLVCIANNDTLISPQHSLMLAEKFAGKVITQEIAKADHNSILVKDDYWEKVGQFLKQIN